MNHWNDPHVGEAASELLAQRALIGLDPDEARELETLLGVAGTASDDALSMDRLAARLHEAVDPELFDAAAGPIGDIPAMPESLRSRLAADSARFVRPASSTSAEIDPDRTTAIETVPAALVRPRSSRQAEASPAISSSTDPSAPAARGPIAASASDASRGVLATLMPWLGWTAAAAVLALVVLAPPRSTPPAAAPSIESVLAQATDRIEVPLAGLPGIADSARGRVVWSGAMQRGYIVLSGLEANDPTDRQYQLWMFDAERTARNETFNAVDGGVFDVPAGADELVIEIDAKLDVFQPNLFAITSEPPGGVVKHDPEMDPDRFRIVAVAEVPTPGADVDPAD